MRKGAVGKGASSPSAPSLATIILHVNSSYALFFCKETPGYEAVVIKLNMSPPNQRKRQILHEIQHCYVDLLCLQLDNPDSVIPNLNKYWSYAKTKLFTCFRVNFMQLPVTMSQEFHR
jgi:hypothetical protein